MAKRYGRKKGQRRAFERKFAASYVNAGQGIDKRYIDRHKNNSRSMGRVVNPAEFRFDSQDCVIKPKITHQQPLPNTRGHMTETGTWIPGLAPERSKVVEKWHEFHKKLHEEGKAVAAHMAAWFKKEVESGFPVLPRVLVYEGGITKTKIWMYYSKRNSEYILVQEAVHFFKCSITYTTRERAKLALDDRRVTWIEYQSRG